MDIAGEQNWYERMETIKRSEDLLKAIKELDGATAATLIREIRNSSSAALLDCLQKAEPVSRLFLVQKNNAQ